MGKEEGLGSNQGSELRNPAVTISFNRPRDFDSLLGKFNLLDEEGNRLISPYNFDLIGETIARLINLVQQEKPITIVWLDKGARPFEAIFREACRQINNIQRINNKPKIKIPPARFVNIGHEMSEEASELKLTTKRLEYYGRRLGRRFHDFKGENIVIVDDFARSGVTLEQAVQAFTLTYEGIGNISTVLFNTPALSLEMKDPEASGIFETYTQMQKGEFPVTDFVVASYTHEIGVFFRQQRRRANRRLPWGNSRLERDAAKRYSPNALEEAGTKKREVRRKWKAIGDAIVDCSSISSQ